MPLAVDTNVLVSAIGWSGPEEKLVLAGTRGDVELVVHLAVLAEFVEVLARPAFDELPREDLRHFLRMLVRRSRLVAPDLTLNVVAEDPPDNRVLEAALGAGCELVVSGDRHLLSLGTVDDLEVVRAPEALDRIDG